MSEKTRNTQFPKFRTLIVEDEPAVAKLLSRHLKSSAIPNLAVDTSNTVEDSISFIEKRANERNPYDVVLLDLSSSMQADAPLTRNAAVYNTLQSKMSDSVVVVTSAFANDPTTTRLVLKETMRSPTGPRTLFFPRDEPFWVKEVCEAIMQVHQKKVRGSQDYDEQRWLSSKSCFISYSHRDEPFVKKLFRSLKAAGIDVWYAPANMKPGVKLHEEIETNIRLYDKLLLVISEYSMNSNWVSTELRTAFEEETRTGKRKLVPIRIIDFRQIAKWRSFNSDIGRDMAVELREYFIQDFSNWISQSAYKRSLKKLLDVFKMTQGIEDPFHRSK
jgi:CheY-like chemotaxis protein